MPGPVTAESVQASAPWGTGFPLVNVTCGAPGNSGSASALPEFAQTTDKYLTQGVQPFLSIPLWVWIGLVGAGVWYFWGQYHWKGIQKWAGI